VSGCDVESHATNTNYVRTASDELPTARRRQRRIIRTRLKRVGVPDSAGLLGRGELSVTNATVQRVGCLDADRPARRFFVYSLLPSIYGLSIASRSKNDHLSATD
jgi:hypothetical protein